MTIKKDICNWLMFQNSGDTLFLSIHFKNPPKNKIALCIRCKPLFIGIFRKYLGRHWIKRYTRHFGVIGFQEFGKLHHRHAHFLLWSNSEIKPESIIKTVQQMSYRLKMDVWSDECDKLSAPKQYGDDIMIKPIYSNLIFQYLTKEIFVQSSSSWANDAIILDIDIIH